MTIGRAACLAQFRHAEIQHLDRAAPRDKQIGGLDVAMDDALRVSGIERIGDLRAKLEDFASGQRSALEAILQRLPIEQLHHHELARLP